MRSLNKEWKDNLDKMLTRLEEIKKLPARQPGIYLHLGCGPQILEGFLNIDKYSDHPEVLKQDMQDLHPFKGQVAAIYSSHSLEHLPYRRAKLALQKWSEALQTEGRVFLAIPDLGEIMFILSDPNLIGRMRDWYMYTLFGYQADPDKHGLNNLQLNLPVDNGQFHQCGFTKATIRENLERLGFRIDTLFNYDGWSTPSIWVEATKV